MSSGVVTTDIHSNQLTDEMAGSKRTYRDFIESMWVSEGAFKLTSRAEPTPFALCFGLFGLNLLEDRKILRKHARFWAQTLRCNLQAYRDHRAREGDLKFDKPFLQLLTFSLSVLKLLGTLEENPLEQLIVPLLSTDIRGDLEKIGSLNGVAGSGNLAMFMAIILIHARDCLGIDTQARLEQWVELHLSSMNRFGFWGQTNSMTYLQFQNGYHQYEILEYLGVDNPKKTISGHGVASLADRRGQFAPYPGGGGCYDYDAVFLLTACGKEIIEKYRDLLVRTAETLLGEQKPDGGFSESHRVRPRSLANVFETAGHIAKGRGRARLERLRYGLTLLRPKYNRIQTHWSTYSRKWSESDLWDSWFRMATLARIDIALNPAPASHVRWGFIDYPGIGHHSLLY